jgi:hypothetical protein
MFYVLDSLPTIACQSIDVGLRCYNGSQFVNYYKTDSNNSYDKTLAHGQFSGDAETYCFIRIKNAVGWQPFKQMFRWFIANSPSSATPRAKFELVLDKLSEFSGVNVRNTFPPGELAIVENAIPN